VEPETAQRQGSQPRWRTALDVVATLAIIAAAGTMIWSSRAGASPPPIAARPEPPLPTEPVSIEGSPAMGSPTAKVVVIAFSDFECPYCGRFAREVLPELKKQYIDTGHVQFVFKHLPLTIIHPRALAAAVAAECADEQGKFWEFHDQLFAGTEDLDSDGFGAKVAALGGSDDQFRACIERKGPEKVAMDLAEAQRLSLTGTPTFLVGSRLADEMVKVLRVARGLSSPDAFMSDLADVLD
jgi:protein-disulfide isomerase